MGISGQHADVDLASLVPSAELEQQINVPPVGDRGLWKVITSALRCPSCQSTHHKAETGKRINHDGLLEQYRWCDACHIRFRVVFE